MSKTGTTISNGRRTETRASAVDRIGSHWKVSGWEHPTVEEVLGPPHLSSLDPRFPSHDLAGACRAAVRQRAEWAASEAAATRRRLEPLGVRIAVWLAMTGLHPRSQAIMEDVDHIRRRTKALDNIVSGSGNPEWEPVIARLPDTLRLPVPIEVGDVVWEVGYEWPIEHGARLVECQVTRLAVYQRFGENEPYDADIHYQAKRRGAEGVTLPSGDLSFTYDRDDFSNPSVETSYRAQSGLFLTRDAAIVHLRELAARLSARAGEASALADKAERTVSAMQS